MACCHVAQLRCGIHLIPRSCNHGGHHCSHGSRAGLLKIDGGHHQQVSICLRSSSVKAVQAGADCSAIAAAWSILTVSKGPGFRRTGSVWKLAYLVKKVAGTLAACTGTKAYVWVCSAFFLGYTLTNVGGEPPTSSIPTHAAGCGKLNTPGATPIDTIVWSMQLGTWQTVSLPKLCWRLGCGHGLFSPC